jgi:acyl carrier protein
VLFRSLGTKEAAVMPFALGRETWYDWSDLVSILRTNQNPITMASVIEILDQIRPECDFRGSQDFLGDGMLDSFDMVVLVAELEKAYSISIDGTDILPENFQNLAAIQALLGKYGVTA